MTIAKIFKDYLDSNNYDYRTAMALAESISVNVANDWDSEETTYFFTDKSRLIENEEQTIAD